MSEVILKGIITKLEIGVTAASNTDITNIIYFRYNRNHDIRPAFVSATKTPDHWNQPHSWIIWELALLGYHTAWTTVDVDNDTGGTQVAYDEDGDSTEIDYFMVSYLSKADVAMTTRLYGAIAATMDRDLNDRQDVITIIRGLAKYKEDA